VRVEISRDLDFHCWPQTRKKREEKKLMLLPNFGTSRVRNRLCLFLDDNAMCKFYTNTAFEKSRDEFSMRYKNLSIGMEIKITCFRIYFRNIPFLYKNKILFYGQIMIAGITFFSGNNPFLFEKLSFY